MNRNVESHFSQNPSLLNVKRSTMRIPFEHKTSFNIGSIIPFFAEEVLPGDSWRVKTSKVVRLQTLLNPIMSNIYLDIYYFFIPFRLVWEHWANLFGENTESAWIPEIEYTTPQMEFEDGDAEDLEVGVLPHLGVEEKTLADYFGMPTGVSGLSMSALYARAYHLVWSEFFRDQSLQDPLNIYKGDETREIPNTQTGMPDDWHPLDERWPFPRLANRYHDYFSSALPNAQRGEPVEIPINYDKAIGWLPVYGQPTMVPETTPYSLNYPVRGHFNSSEALGYDGWVERNFYDTGNVSRGAPSSTNAAISQGNQMHFDNLWASLDNWTKDFSINVESLRQANMLQHMLEVDALGGGRMRELLRSHFGVVSPDSRLQVPEYLGGNRISLTVHEVVNQTEGENAFLGNLGAMSHTSDVHNEFVRSFTESGLVLGLAVARYDNSFYQGIPRKFSRSGRYSYYWPSLAGLGSQAILNKEIFAQGPTVVNPDTGKAYDDEVFGYSEAWAEYRYGTPSLITSEMRPSATNSLASWHLSDNYDSMPYLSADWIAVDKDIPDRVLAVSSDVADQIFADFYVENICTRVMPLYSIPGMYNYF